MARKLILISLFGSIITIILKFTAAKISNSVGIFSDALESCINLVASTIAYVALTLAEKPADKKHTYGYAKVEYFASGLEGGLILIASLGIFYAAFKRFFNPVPLEDLNWGIGFILVSTLLNAVIALILFKGAKKYDSIVLEADAKHLLTDVYTTLGVSLGVGITLFWPNLSFLDPIIACMVALHILKAGYHLAKASFLGLLDRALPLEEQDKIKKVVEKYPFELAIHNLRTRKSGHKRFIDFHLLLDGKVSVQKAHDICCDLEEEIGKVFPQSETTIHVEPMQDGRSWQDDLFECAKEKEEKK